jgi:hypothetical protein
MLAHKLEVKIFTRSVEAPPLAAIVRVFQDWIRRGVLGELMIDVVDYGHVHDGPGVVLIGDGSDYALDLAEGRPGLFYRRKRHAPAPPERLRDAFRRALSACRQLSIEPELAGLEFSTEELKFCITDRLTAPNTLETFAVVRPELERFCIELFGGPGSLEQLGTPREPFSVSVRPAKPEALETLLERLGGAPV